MLVDTVREQASSAVYDAGLPAESLLLGGRSMGGRMCSMALAAGLAAAGLVLISYPQHPPGKPERLRVEHCPALTVPCLFVSGTRDEFGSSAELIAATGSIEGEVTHVWIEDGRHELSRSRDRRDVIEAVLSWLRS